MNLRDESNLYTAVLMLHDTFILIIIMLCNVLSMFKLCIVQTIYMSRMKETKKNLFTAILIRWCYCRRNKGIALLYLLHVFVLYKR